MKRPNNSYPYSSIGKAFSPLPSLMIFSLSLVFCSLNMICLVVVFMVFILLGVLWFSWICRLVSVVNFGKFLALTTSNYLFCSVLAFFSYLNYIYVAPFEIIPQFLYILLCERGGLVLFDLSFFLCISVWEVSNNTSFSSLLLSLTAASLLMSPSQAFFISVIPTRI